MKQLLTILAFCFFFSLCSLTYAKPLIVIDPGHGGKDKGAIGYGGLLEKDVVLSVALELERLLNENLDVTVRLTRRDDKYLELKERTQFANDYEATLFISLHGNASRTGNASGFETYYLDNTNDKGSKKLAERENEEHGKPVGDLEFILSDLIQSGKIDDSIALARVVHAELERHIHSKWKEAKSIGVKKAPFYVLVGAHMPCILIELLFVDNKSDSKLLTDRAFRKDLAVGLMLGIERYLKREQ